MTFTAQYRDADAWNQRKTAVFLQHWTVLGKSVRVEGRTISQVAAYLPRHDKNVGLEDEHT